MTYLYAVLGILMMSGIAAIFDMSLKITSQPIEAKLPENNYQKNKFDLKDKLFLELLQNAEESWGSGEDFCDKILSEINSNNFTDLKGYDKSISSTSEKTFFLDSCSFAEANHRLLIKPKSPENSSFYYFSCAVNLEKRTDCDFEGILK